MSITPPTLNKMLPRPRLIDGPLQRPGPVGVEVGDVDDAAAPTTRRVTSESLGTGERGQWAGPAGSSRAACSSGTAGATVPLVPPVPRCRPRSSGGARSAHRHHDGHVDRRAVARRRPSR